MENMVGFLLRASVYLLLFAVAYRLLLSKKVHPTFNRIFLICSMLLTLLLSGLSDIRFESGRETGPVLGATLPEIIVGASLNYKETSALITSLVENTGAVAWFAGTVSAVMLLLLLVQSGRLLWLAFRFRKSGRSGLTYVLLPFESSPFSFFHWFFFPGKLLNDKNFDKVLAHETAHYQRFHSADVLFFELMRVLFWFHPAWYYLRHELKSMHEFEADNLALRRFEKTDYQLSLLELQLSGSLIPLSNPFNVSLIKRRMLMMNHQKWQKPARNWFKMIGLIPVILLFVFVQSCNNDKKNTETTQIESATKSPETTQLPADEKEPEQTDGEVFTVVETMPEFPGGQEAMLKFLVDNISYPEEARLKKIQGRVFVSFIVEKDGKVGNVKILRGIGGGCDEEALRVVGLMPNWKPGEQRGQAVRVAFNLPIRFALQ